MLRLAESCYAHVPIGPNNRKDQQVNGKRWLATAVAVCVGTGVSLAHHAMEYIEMESYTTAKRGEYVFHLHYDYMVDDEDDADLDHWELTPGLSYGLLDRLMCFRSARGNQHSI